ncbi:GtrA family protein [Candidatus Saccharibacteria bacterium]|nr:GtrA family protein [Candidatus Saccharibacteria bacterium]MBR3122188.1 GtrA family protein [Candidatus Saccharibacteria bacterium]
MENESQKDTEKSAEKPEPRDVKTSKHAVRYVIVGIAVTLFNFILYTILSNLILRNNDLLWLSAFISTAITIFVAYLLHSRITWKERKVTKTAIYKFFIWNIIITVAINPLFTQLFSYITPLYEFAFSIIQALHLPLTYEVTLTTGAFALTSIVDMILNFFFYDQFVFGKKHSK